MNKIVKVGLLSLIAIVQVSIIFIQFFAYQEMSKRLSDLRWAYKELSEKIYPEIIIDFGIAPNPFVPLLPLALLGLFAAIVLLTDEVRHKHLEN